MNEAQCRSRLLQLVCLLSGGTALLSLLIAVTSDHWLTTAEPVKIKMPDFPSTHGPETGEAIPPDYTADYTTDYTPDLAPDADLDDDNVDLIDFTAEPFLVIDTCSGLWRICLLQPGEDGVTRPACSAIDYKDLGSDRVSGAETTFSIVRAMRHASLAVVFSLVSLVAGLACATFGRFTRNYFALIGSVILVVTGLLLTLGLVLYVRAVSDEVGYRKPPIDNMPAFQYSYSWSFCFAAIALVSTNIVAVANVYLYQGGYLDVIAPSTSLGMGSAGSEVSFEGAVVIVH